MKEVRPDIAVPGYEVVVLMPQGGKHGRGELRKDDAVWRGQEAFALAIEAVGRTDADLLADLAMTFIDPRGAGRVAWRPGDAVMGDASPQPASVSGNTLRYWRSHDSLPEMVTVQVDLDRGLASVTRPGSGPVADKATAEVLTQARAAVDSGDVDQIRAAISSVSKLDDREAITFLGQYLGGEDRVFLRKVAVEAIGKNKPAGGDALLGVVLTTDKNTDVRRSAVRMLENWDEPEGARAALEQAAAQDGDPVVKAIAARALSKLQ